MGALVNFAGAPILVIDAMEMVLTLVCIAFGVGALAVIAIAAIAEIIDHNRKG
jgi:hypothetical protein